MIRDCKLISLRAEGPCDFLDEISDLRGSLVYCQANETRLP
jgi:hypothetical protein